ncbi:hypothetical protein [Hymenobacter metallicola]|uniref:HEAT repeat domain-containing protein n=1 Tax=Hymenobacter metallicola TaxID=2563114 RepID=A0A4Z0PVN7_9BACT|nr:hypothetical protein [Hymenobacter metallicola]TGE20913.1 hypothetical protein E5K02_25265 [Hymenobacter metallicola]
MEHILTAREIRALQQQLSRAIQKAAPQDQTRHRHLRFIQQAWGDFDAAVPLSKLLRAESREVRHFASVALRFCGNAQVIPALLKAAQAPENAGYARPYIWACAHFDCTPYLPRFLKIITHADDAGSITWASVAVLKRMQGPFDKAALKLHIKQLLRLKIPETTTSVKMHELLLAETGHVLHQHLYLQIADEVDTLPDSGG